MFDCISIFASTLSCGRKKMTKSKVFQWRFLIENFFGIYVYVNLFFSYYTDCLVIADILYYNTGITFGKTSIQQILNEVFF